jgi:hypothetical protein
MTTAVTDSARDPGTFGWRPGAGLTAARRAIAHNSLRVEVPGLATLRLPPPEHWAFYVGLAAVAGFGFIDWPVAGVLALGHLLAEDRHNRLLQDFGEALAEA